ncbi:MAG: CxxxxCH/CxxCH domain-containing protein [Chloroflexi bacterium]|nr:MAG: CxxxxCH/CxxCH domain-containing protein [Chloroflexota bacterium]
MAVWWARVARSVAYRSVAGDGAGRGGAGRAIAGTPSRVSSRCSVLQCHTPSTSRAAQAAPQWTQVPARSITAAMTVSSSDRTAHRSRPA